MLESLRLPFREAIERAAKLGVDGVQMYALDIPSFTNDAIKEKLDIVRSNGLCFSAICGDFGCGFADENANRVLVDKSKRVLDIAKKLECNIVTTHIGRITENETREKQTMRAACQALASYADSIGSSFAVETGPEYAYVLADFLDSLDARGVRVNFDPANLVMVAGDNAASAAKILGRFIVHTHAKDGKKTGKSSYAELPLGEGDVDFDAYLPALVSTGYDGFLTVERECGDNPEADIAKAVDFLKEKKKSFGL